MTLLPVSGASDVARQLRGRGTTNEAKLGQHVDMACSLPFAFEQTDPSLELTVRVAVPSATRREDVAVTA